MAPRIFADFQNADPLGRVRLNTVGSIRGLEGVHLQAGTVLDLYDGDMELKGGVAEYSVDEKIWVARVDWNKFRPLQSTEF
jgi:hypothetical protein